MKKILLTCMVVGWFNVAQADVVNFDDIALPKKLALIANGYSSFNWAFSDSNFYAVNNTFTGNRGVVSGQNAALGFQGSVDGVKLEIAGSGPFDFNNAYFTSFGNDQNLRFEGYNDGSLLYSSTNYAINGLTPLLISLNWSGVDSLQIFGGGLGEPFLWIMDDFTYNQNPDVNAVPLPTAAWLFGSGLLSFAGFRRKNLG